MTEQSPHNVMLVTMVYIQCPEAGLFFMYATYATNIGVLLTKGIEV